MITTESKRYFTVAELMRQALEQAKADPQYTELTGACPLDYAQEPFNASKLLLTRCAFNAQGYAEYGGCEGIYGDIVLDGDTGGGRPSSRLCVYTLKTLEEDKAAYLAMGTLATLIAYYVGETVRRNLDRFD